MSVEIIPFEDAVRMAYTGEIEDGKTIVGLVLAARRLQGAG
jgi:hypothetical protein